MQITVEHLPDRCIITADNWKWSNAQLALYDEIGVMLANL
jgi:hypothetical protein